MPLTLRYVVADVFTDTPLTGNQLAVFTDAREVDDELMQSLTREMNYSESVFVLPPESDGHARIRIFTPATELPFAGHPTLGSAFVLGQPLQLEEIRLETGAGTIPVRLEREGAQITFGWMTQPVPRWRPYERADELLSVLGVESQLPVDWYDLGPSFVYVALRSADEVAALAPNFQELLAFEPASTASRRWTAAGRAACSRREAAWPRTRPPARRPGRSPCICFATAASRRATRSRSCRASS